MTMGFDITSFLMGKAAGGGGGGGGGGDPALPAEYQEVEYLNTNGDAWSQVSFNEQSGDFLDITFLLPATAPSTELAMIGNPNTFEVYTKNNSLIFYNKISGTSQSVERDTTYTVTGKFAYTFSSATQWYIGTYSDSAYHFVGRIGTVRNYYKNIDNQMLILAKYVPCKRKSDNVPGFCEVLSGTFYPSVTNTPWTAGPDVN